MVGYGIMQLKSSWAHIMNVCVAPPARRHGVGTRIMRHLLDLARREHATGAWLEVRPGNVQALQLYRRLGFRAIGRRRHYYRDRWGRTDASVMIRRQAGG